jgi:hypothetical protein
VDGNGLVGLSVQERRFPAVEPPRTAAGGSNIRAMAEVMTAREGYELWRPNREKTESKTTKAIIAFVLLISAALILIISFGGWDKLLSTSVGFMGLVWAGLYVLFAVLVARWNRGILPVAAALAIILTIFAAIAGPEWFDRSKEGFTSPALPEDLIGLLTLILVPVQILLIVVAMIGFNQEWHVEEERPVGGEPLAGENENAFPPPSAEPVPAEQQSWDPPPPSGQPPPAPPPWEPPAPPPPQTQPPPA